MRIAFDVHGTLDRSPQMIIILMKMFEGSGHEVFIMSGPPREEIESELLKINREYFSNFRNIFSIVDFAKSEGVTMHQNENGSWLCDEFYWWASKGLMCMKFDINMIFDNEIKYKSHMPKKTIFVHWDRQQFIGV